MNELLNQVAHQVDSLPEQEQRRQVSSYVQLMAGLKYDKDIVRRLFREDIMRESVIYQEIFQEGEVRGEARGEARGQRLVIARLLSKRFGTLSPSIAAQLESLSLTQVQSLEDELFEFRSIADLTQWLDLNGK